MLMLFIAAAAMAIAVMILAVCIVVYLFLRNKGAVSKKLDMIASPASTYAAMPNGIMAPPLRHIGEIGAKCPYCQVILKKKPGTKKKCPNCGNLIYVRKRPIDEQKVLLREEDLDTLEEQKAIASGYYEDYLARKTICDQLRQSFIAKCGRDPSNAEIDLEYNLYSMTKNANKRNYGLFRYALYELANTYNGMGEYEHALEAYMRLYYTDANGPSNIDGSIELSGWEPSLGIHLPPSDCVEAVVKLGIDEITLYEVFLKEANIIREQFSMPLDPKTVWPAFSNQLFTWVQEEKKERSES